MVSSACSPNAHTHAPVASAPWTQSPSAPSSPDSDAVPFKRVDDWRYVDLNLPLSSVEIELGEHLRRVFAPAQPRMEYTCLARESANFRALHAAVPEESLEYTMFGRCGAPDSGGWRSVPLSGARVLDTPLSPELLNEITTKLSDGLGPFTVFGVTARYTGSGALVVMEYAAPEASVHVGTPDGEGNFVVEGDLLADYAAVDAVVNQGELGTARCTTDPAVRLPRYALRCRMLEGDEQAWVEVTAIEKGTTWEQPLLHIQVRMPGWVPPAEYHRVRWSFPKNEDVTSSVLGRLNELRAKAGREPMTLARAQSAAMQPAYERMFQINATGNWSDDRWLRDVVVKGTAVQGDIWFGRIVSGIAFDGNAADWLEYRLHDPLWREALMAPDVNQLALATHADPKVGFGALAVVYAIFTPQRERALADAIAARISQLRQGRVTRRLDTPHELTRAAAAVASGLDVPEHAFPAALTHSSADFTGKLLELSGPSVDFDLEQRLLDLHELDYGIVVTHCRYPNDDWSTPIAFMWYRAQLPTDSQRARPLHTRRDTPSQTHTP